MIGRIYYKSFLLNYAINEGNTDILFNLTYWLSLLSYCKNEALNTVKQSEKYQFQFSPSTKALVSVLSNMQTDTSFRETSTR